jgi:hypothetical protein
LFVEKEQKVSPFKYKFVNEPSKYYYKLCAQRVEVCEPAQVTENNRKARIPELLIEYTDAQSRKLDVACSEAQYQRENMKYYKMISEKSTDLISLAIPSSNMSYTPYVDKKDLEKFIAGLRLANVIAPDDRAEEYATPDNIPTFTSIISPDNELLDIGTIGQISYTKKIKGKDGKEVDTTFPMLALTIYHDEAIAKKDQRKDIDIPILMYRHSIECAVFNDDVCRLYGIYNLSDLFKVMKIYAPTLLLLGSYDGGDVDVKSFNILKEDYENPKNPMGIL